MNSLGLGGGGPIGAALVDLNDGTKALQLVTRTGEEFSQSATALSAGGEFEIDVSEKANLLVEFEATALLTAALVEVRGHDSGQYMPLYNAASDFDSPDETILKYYVSEDNSALTELSANTRCQMLFDTKAMGSIKFTLTAASGTGSMFARGE